MIKITLLLTLLFNTSYALSIYNCVECGVSMPTEPNWRDNYDIYSQPLIDRPSYPIYPNTFRSPYMMPWWYSYGMINYPNFNYPGMWNQPGGYLPGHHYPGDSGMAAMKPNIYITGPEGKEFELTLELKGSLLVSAPALDKSVKGTIVERGIKVDDAIYPYLYYDFRLEGDQFQNEQGFCTEARTLLVKMAQILEKSGFKKNEVKDFYQHWMIKIPPDKSYCVYPQSNIEISTESILKIDASLNRLYFIVIPQSAKYKGRFNEKPNQDWIIPLKKTVPKEVQLREWAIVFLMN